MNKALAAIHMHLMMHVAVQGKGTSPTKKGPGRMPANRSVGAPRLQTRTAGGNWQGLPYLSYLEHDRCTRYSISDAGPNASKAARRSEYSMNMIAVHDARTAATNHPWAASV